MVGPRLVTRAVDLADHDDRGVELVVGEAVEERARPFGTAGMQGSEEVVGVERPGSEVTAVPCGLHLAVARHRRVGAGRLGDAAHDGAIAVRMVRQPVGDDHVAVPVTHRRLRQVVHDEALALLRERTPERGKRDRGNGGARPVVGTRL